MACGVTATWTAVAGNEAVVADATRYLAVETPGAKRCLIYITRRSTEGLREFFIHERLIGQHVFDPHPFAPPFQRDGREMAVPRLETGGRTLHELLD